jgi:thymidine phosphorylase
VQGGKLKKIPLAKFQKNILSKKSGKISSMNNKKINSLARIAGCPLDKSSGLYLYVHIGNEVKKRDKILIIYSESKSRLKQAVKFYKEHKPIEVK